MSLKSKSLNRGFLLESEQRAAELKRGESTAVVLSEMFKLEGGKSPLARAIRAKFDSWGKAHKNLDLRTLDVLYVQVSRRLTKFYALKDVKVTPPQENFYRWFKEHSRLKILKEVWIGNHCPDFVIPGTRTNRSHGAIVEIDGSIHSREFKMSKDNHAEELYRRVLRCGVYRLNNEDVTYERVKDFAQDLGQRRLMDSRGSRRWRREVGIITTAFGGQKLPQDQIEQLDAIIAGELGLSVEQLNELRTLSDLKRSSKYRSNQK